MAEGVIKDIRTCLWNPDKGRRRESGERHRDKGMVAAHFISFDGDDPIEICKQCAELDHFKDAFKYPIVRHFI